MHRKKNSLERGLIVNKKEPCIGRIFHGQGNEGLLHRIPYFSLIAFALSLVGSLLFFIMMFWSFNASIGQIRKIFNHIQMPWLDKVHMVFIVSALLMLTFSIALLCIGILSTGNSRNEIYTNVQSRRGGTLLCSIAIIFSYFLNVLWIIIASISSILCFIYAIFGSLCSSIKDDDQCLSFDIFRPLIKDYSDSNLILCKGEVDQFCAIASTVTIWYFIGFVGSVLVCIALLQFAVSNSANYVHIANEGKLAELKNIIYNEAVNLAHSELDRQEKTFNKTAQNPLDLLRGLHFDQQSYVDPGSCHQNGIGRRRNSYQNFVAITRD